MNQNFILKACHTILDNSIRPKSDIIKFQIWLNMYIIQCMMYSLFVGVIASQKENKDGQIALETFFAQSLPSSPSHNTHNKPQLELQ